MEHRADPTDRGGAERGGEVPRDLPPTLERATQRLTLLQEIASALASVRLPQDVAEAIVSRVRPALGAHRVSVRLLSETGNLDSLVVRQDLGGLSSLPTLAIDSDLPSAEAVRRRAPVWLRTREALLARYPAQAEAAVRLGIVSVAALPLCVGDRCLGSLALFFDRPNRFDDGERGFIESIAVHCAQALERARLFEAERRARELAERAYAELDAMVENAPLGVAFLDREMRYRRINRVLADLNGMAVEEHLGRTPRELFPGLPVDALEAQFRDVLATGVPRVDEEIAGEGRAAPGRRRVTLASWYPVLVAGEAVGAGVLVREVTAEREAQEFQRHVLGVVGHDLRNPLAAIHGTAALLRRAPLGDWGLRNVDRILSSAGRMEEIIRALLDYTRARGSGVPVERRPCDVGEICRTIAAECEDASPDREVRCSGEGPTGCTWDPGRIAQMVGNLVTNALQHGDANAPVELRWRGAGDDVVIEVANRGPPIPPAALGTIFEPFARVATQGGSGLGLGLFIARQIAIAHGGRLDVRSSAADGTVFVARLPREQSPPCHAAGTQA